MNRLKKTFMQLAKGLSAAILRFPFTVACLLVATALTCYIIYQPYDIPLAITKGIFTLVVGAMLGMTAQFALERFDKLDGKKLPVYGLTLLLTAAYWGILWPAPEISGEVVVRSIVAVFAMLCAVLWMRAYRDKADFNVISLIHFKAFFTSILYSIVVSIGISAILFAMDALLFRVDSDVYAYVMAIVWVLFAPLFYLSLLPKFNWKTEEEGALAQEKSHYPRFFEVLVCYIAIPLFTAYTLVLLAYFLKILVTFEWPSGIIGPMVLVYSAVGLVIFILASLPENRFAVLFRKIFPKVWIPIILMQMVSVWIRLNAYGITESRYYVTSFAVFSLASAVILSLWPVKRNKAIALLAVFFAVVSIIPPVDAFSLSRNSQIHRVEGYLTAEGILSREGTLTPNPNATEESKKEITNIISYLNYNSSLEYISWLPEDFVYYRDMKEVFGFEPFYPSEVPSDNKYFYASLDTEAPLDVAGYQISFNMDNYGHYEDERKERPFTLDGIKYTLVSTRLSDADVELFLEDESGRRLIGTRVYGFAEKVMTDSASSKDTYSPEEMTLTVNENGYGLKIVFTSINISQYGSNDVNGAYSAYVLVQVPDPQHP